MPLCVPVGKLDPSIIPTKMFTIFWYSLYDRSAAGRGDLTHRILHMRQPSLWDKGGPIFHGYTALGSWLYIIDGTGRHDTEHFNSYVRAVSLNTGLIRAQFLTKAG